MYKYSFEKLVVWKEAIEFTGIIYSITSNFPNSERFGLSDQLRKASISICSNLAEGSSRSTKREKARFTTIAFGSAMEILNQLIISNNLKYIDNNAYSVLRLRLNSIANKLNALRKSQLQNGTTM